MFSTFNGFIVQTEGLSRDTYGTDVYFYYQVITPEPYCVFQGTFYKTSTSATKNKLLVPIELIQWACLDYFNDDQSLFEKYTSAQLAFASSSRIEEFNCLSDDVTALIENRQYKTILNEPNAQIISFREIHQTLTILFD